MDNREESLKRLRQLAAEKGILNLDDNELAKVLNSQRPKIKLPGDNRELGQFASEVGDIVMKAHLYRRDRTAVIINHEKKRLDIVSAEMLRTWVETHLVCYREKVTGKGDEKALISIYRTMNLDAARGTLESNQFLFKLSEIERVNETRLPVVRRDKTIELLAPGYFFERGMFTFDDGLQLDETMKLPDATKVIDELLQYFPFPNPRSKAVVIAAMLTMFCATMLPRNALRPGFIYTANSPGAGKTLLAKIAVIPIVGRAATRTLPRREEAKKVLDVCAMNAVSYILFDNIRGKIAGEDLEQFITSSEIEGRLLGESTNFRVPNVATIFLTGNQSTTSSDMAERCLFVELFVEEADNRDRKIPFVIDDAYLSQDENRARILSALWSFVRHWDANGRTRPPSLLPRFEIWSEIIAGIVIAAGYADPLAKPEMVGLGDVELADMRELVHALAPEPPKEREEWKFPDVIDKAVELGLFTDVEVRSGKTTDQMFNEDGVTMAGRSHFGKLLARYDQRMFAVAERRLRFVVEGKGKTRVFVVVDIDTAAASASEPF